MKKLLYIGHVFHLRTQSTQFLLDELKKEYEVTCMTMDPTPGAPNHLDYSAVEGQHFDLLVCLQVMPSVYEMRRYFTFDRGAFFPMADYYFGAARIGTNKIWQEYADFQIICFSKAVYDEAVAAGFSAKYLQYFPRPQENPGNWGDPRSIFFWQRVTDINMHLLVFLFQNYRLEHVHMHYALDPGERKIALPELPMNPPVPITSTEWFPTRQEMQAKMEESGLYMAPRIMEGIGMSFLEAMAHGRCVVAENSTTMNEYIEDGKNGFLYRRGDHIDPLKIHSEKDILQIQKNTLEYMNKGYAQWVKTLPEMLSWCVEKPDFCAEKLQVSAAKFQWDAFVLPGTHVPTFRQKIKSGLKKNMPTVLQKVVRKYWNSLRGGQIQWSVRQCFSVLGIPLFVRRYGNQKTIVRIEICGIPVFEDRKEKF